MDYSREGGERVHRAYKEYKIVAATRRFEWIRSGNTHNTQSMLDLQRHLHRVHRADRSSLRPARMLYGIICVYLLAKAYECNVRYFILHRNVPLRSDVVQFFAVFAAQKICSLNPSLSLSRAHPPATDTPAPLTLSLTHTLPPLRLPSSVFTPIIRSSLSTFASIDGRVKYVTTIRTKKSHPIRSQIRKFSINVQRSCFQSQISSFKILHFRTKVPPNSSNVIYNISLKRWIERRGTPMVQSAVTDLLHFNFFLHPDYPFLPPLPPYAHIILHRNKNPMTPSRIIRLIFQSRIHPVLQPAGCNRPPVVIPKAAYHRVFIFPLGMSPSPRVFGEF